MEDDSSELLSSSEEDNDTFIKKKEEAPIAKEEEIEAQKPEEKTEEVPEDTTEPKPELTQDSSSMKRVGRPSTLAQDFTMDEDSDVENSENEEEENPIQASPSPTPPPVKFIPVAAEEGGLSDEEESHSEADKDEEATVTEAAEEQSQCEAENEEQAPPTATEEEPQSEADQAPVVKAANEESLSETEENEEETPVAAAEEESRSEAEIEEQAPVVTTAKEETPTEAEKTEEAKESSDSEEEVQAKSGDETQRRPYVRKRNPSTFSMETAHATRMKDLESKKQKEREDARKAHSKGTTAHLSVGTAMGNLYKEEAERARVKKLEQDKLVAEVKHSTEDSDARLEELKKSRKKGKKKVWKPKMHGYLNLVASSMKVKKGKEHKVDVNKGMYFAIDRLPSTCNIDATEAEWTKNKKADSLCPALVAFSTKKKYLAFEKKVAKKNMRLSGGLMCLAVHACGIIKLNEEFAVAETIAHAIGDLKSEMLRTDAVLPVDSFRGGDSGSEMQITIVDRKQAIVLTCDEEEDFQKWLTNIKEIS